MSRLLLGVLSLDVDGEQRNIEYTFVTLSGHE